MWKRVLFCLLVLAIGLATCLADFGGELRRPAKST